MSEMKVHRKFLAVILILLVPALAVGCAKVTSERKLTLGAASWDESIAVSNLTKVLLEDELGYDRVELKTLDTASLFESVSGGDLDAFQAVRLPNHQRYLSSAQDEVELLDPWFQGTPRIGIAVPRYMNITSIPQLNQSGAEEIIGIEPDVKVSKIIPDEVIPTYNLKQGYTEWSAPAMLYEVGKRLSNKEQFAFIAWSPHWMNQRYDFVYLDDPENALGELNDPSSITTIVGKYLWNDEPVAYALMKTMTLTEEQIDSLEEAINTTGDPLEGARDWARDNRDVVQPWIYSAKQAGQPF